MTATLTERPALLNVDTEDGLTTFAWDVAPWDAYLDLWLSAEDAELLTTLTRLPFIYDDGTDSDLASLELFTEAYAEAGVIARAWTLSGTETSAEDRTVLTCGVLQSDIAAGVLVWDLDSQTLRNVSA